MCVDEAGHDQTALALDHLVGRAFVARADVRNLVSLIDDVAVPDETVPVTIKGDDVVGVLDMCSRHRSEAANPSFRVRCSDSLPLLFDPGIEEAAEAEQVLSVRAEVLDVLRHAVEVLDVHEGVEDGVICDYLLDLPQGFVSL